MSNQSESEQTELATDVAADDVDNRSDHEKRPLSEHVEHYAGHISSRHGTVHWWLAIVYLILFIWALYYGFTYWGGLGPGLDY